MLELLLEQDNHLVVLIVLAELEVIDGGLDARIDLSFLLDGTGRNDARVAMRLQEAIQGGF